MEVVLFEGPMAEAKKHLARADKEWTGAGRFDAYMLKSGAALLIWESDRYAENMPWNQTFEQVRLACEWFHKGLFPPKK